MKKLDEKIVAKMTDEQRERYEVKLKRAKRNRAILGAVIALIVVAATCFVLCITVLFNITKITVKDSGKYYKPEEIISASGLDVGKNMIRTDFENAAERIEMNLPYVYDVKIVKSANGVVAISVTDAKQSMVVKCQNGYAITDDKCKVLEIVKEIPKNKKLLVLTTKKSVDAKLGKKFTFADENESELYNTVKTALDKSEFKEITAIDISNPNDIYADYQNRFRLKFGTSDNIEKKLLEAKKVIESENKTNSETIAQINLSVLKKVYVTPVETLEETTTALSEETTTVADDEYYELLDEEQEADETYDEDEEYSDEEDEEYSE